MRKSLLIISTTILICGSEVYAISKVHTWEPQIPMSILNMTHAVQFVSIYDSTYDVEKAPFIARIDRQNQSLKVFAPKLGDEDSLYYHFIPGDKIAIQLLAAVTWNEETELLEYNYSLYSLESSILPIWHFELEYVNYYNKITNPKEWKLLILPPELPAQVSL